MTVPGLEVRHRERAIDCRVEGDGDDHEKRPSRLCTVRVEYHRSRPPSAGPRDGASGEQRTGSRAAFRRSRPRSGRGAGRARPGARLRSARRSSRRPAAPPARLARAACARRARRRARPNGAAAHAYGCAATSRSVRYCETPHASRPCEVDVPLRARRAAEDHRVDRVARAPRGGDLAPARVVRVAGLDADQPGKDAEQVVPRVHDERPVLDRVVAHGARGRARSASASPPARARRRRARSTRGPGASSPSGRTKCVSRKPERARARVHPADEARDVAARCGRRRARPPRCSRSG